VRMGAVVTNNAAVGQSTVKLDLGATALYGGRVINISADKLWETTDTTASFAVRILNIPADKADVVIYARPYYVFAKDGAEIIVYGDITSSSYAQAAA